MLGEGNQYPRLISQAERKLTLPWAFCSTLALNKLDDAQLHGGGPSALLSPPIQMLILPRNTLTDMPRSNVRSGHLMSSQLTQNSAGIKLPASLLKTLKIETAL